MNRLQLTTERLFTPRSDEEQRPLADEKREQANERIRETFDEARVWIVEADDDEE